MNRVIFLVDMNAFFITCEMRRSPHLRGKPSAVAGDPKKRTGIILAANYEARALGIKTAMTLHEALKKCPTLQTVPPDHAYYEEMSEKVMTLLSSYTPLVEKNSIDEAWLDMTGSLHRFSSAFEAAAQIMEHIRLDLQLWCSIGISSNKFLSKMASEMKKPLGITELFPQDVKEKLWPLPVDAMYGVGTKTAELLYKENIRCIGDLAQYDFRHLIRRFGKSGFSMHQHANGLDPEPVVIRTKDDLKSIGKSITLPENLSEFNEARKILHQLSDEVSERARMLEKKGRTVQITLKYTNFKTITRQSQISSTNLSKYIYETGELLLKEVWRSSMPVRLIGITLTDLVHIGEMVQLDLFDTIPHKEETGFAEVKREENLQTALDFIQKKFGQQLVVRGWILSDSKREIHPSESKEP